MAPESFFERNGLVPVEKLAKGWTSYIYLVKDSRGKKFAAKCLREKSNRKQMAKREAENLRLANSKGAGPRLAGFDEDSGVVLMEFVEGVTFDKWLFETNVSQSVLFPFLKELFSQAEKLDEIGLDHGQLAGRGRNILVRGNNPVIIDFEKASLRRKPGNVNQLKSFLFLNPNSRIAKKISEVLREKAGLFL